MFSKGKYQSYHDWVDDCYLDAPIQGFAYDAKYDSLFMFEVDAVHRRDNRGRFWRSA